jgi:hypothetical protein
VSTFAAVRYRDQCRECHRAGDFVLLFAEVPANSAKNAVPWQCHRRGAVSQVIQWCVNAYASIGRQGSSARLDLGWPVPERVGDARLPTSLLARSVSRRRPGHSGNAAVLPHRLPNSMLHSGRRSRRAEQVLIAEPDRPLAIPATGFLVHPITIKESKNVYLP